MGDCKFILLRPLPTLPTTSLFESDFIKFGVRHTSTRAVDDVIEMRIEKLNRSCASLVNVVNLHLDGYPIPFIRMGRFSNTPHRTHHLMKQHLRARSLSTNINYLAPIERLVPPEQPFRVREVRSVGGSVGRDADQRVQYAYPPPKGRPEHNEVLIAHQCEVGGLFMGPTNAGSPPSANDRSLTSENI